MPKNENGNFGVEWGNNPLADHPAHSEWDTQEECIEEAQRKNDLGFTCIWCAAWCFGRQEWLYFWWSEATNWGDLPPSGFGRRAPRGENFKIIKFRCD